jgi:hypothetical protein
MHQLDLEWFESGFQRLESSFVVTENSGRLSHDYESKGVGEAGKCHTSNRFCGY